MRYRYGHRQNKNTKTTIKATPNVSKQPMHPKRKPQPPPGEEGAREKTNQPCLVAKTEHRPPPQQKLPVRPSLLCLLASPLPHPRSTRSHAKRKELNPLQAAIRHFNTAVKCLFALAIVLLAKSASFFSTPIPVSPASPTARWFLRLLAPNAPLHGQTLASAPDAACVAAPGRAA